MQTNGGININWRNRGSLPPVRAGGAQAGFVAIVVLALATILIVIFTYIYLVRDESVVVEDNRNKSFGDLVQVVSPDEIPGSLPKDLPIEKDVTLMKNELVYFANTGEIHAVRSYYTQKTQEEVYTDFKKYFDTNKWEILSTVNEGYTKFILARKEGVNGVLQFSVYKNQIDGRILVETIKIDKSSNSM